MSVRVQCPSCGGPVVFEVGSSMVAVCPYCRSAVARGDRDIENLGKVADLVDTGAILRVGLEGKFEGRKFRLTGRTQLGHEAGGVWDEWYAAFSDDTWGWISEAQGRFYILFEQDQDHPRPDYDGLRVGKEVLIPESDRRFVVAETGTATVLGAEGEIPYRIVPDSVYPYADLSGTGGAFATFDFSQSPPALYLGREVTLDELGVPENIRREVFELREVQAKRINCPNCCGPLELRAPDRTERVGCPYCGSMLDATRGELKLLHALDKPPFKLQIPLGTRGKFDGRDRTVIGALTRSVTVEGIDYKWQEYLLYHPRDGFEWLICNDGHWTRVKGIPAGDVVEGKYLAQYNGRTFRKFQVGVATIRGVIGECYWKVSVGEEAVTADYIRPPELLSVERSSAGGSKEVNWSVGSYLTSKEVEAAFDLKESLPSPRGVAPNQPFRYWQIYRYAAGMFLALCALGIIILIASPARKVHEQTFMLRSGAPAAAPATAVAPTTPVPPPEKTQIFFTDHFELKGGRNLRITVECPQLTGWLVAEGDLIQQSNGEVVPFLIPLTYYSGTDGGESWTEGSKKNSEYLSAQPKGTYSLKLEVEKEKSSVAGPLKVTVEEGVAHLSLWFLALVGVLALPLVVGFYHLLFVSKRWENADFSMFNVESLPSPEEREENRRELRERLARSRERKRKKRPREEGER